MPTVTEKGITQWTIPENIHTIPQTAFRNSEGKGKGGLCIGNLKAWGNTCDWIPKAWRVKIWNSYGTDKEG